jgi:ADP-ribosylation factor related protein 1
MYTDARGLSNEHIVPTVGLNIAKLEAFGSKLMFWDLGGQPGLRAIWGRYYAQAHALVFVVDSSSDGFQANMAKDTLQGVLASCKLSGAPVLVLANKSDLGGTDGVHSIKKQFNSALVDASHDRSCYVLSVCALSGEGLR